MPIDDRGGVPFLRIFGRVGPDNRLVLRPCYLIERPRDGRSRRPPVLIAEVLGADGDVLVRTPLSTRSYCVEGSGDATLAVRGSVPLPPEAARIVILRPDSSGRDPIAISELEVPETAPAVRIAKAPAGAAEGCQVVAWEADGDPPPVEYRVSYSHDDGRTWLPVGRRTTSREALFDVDELPGGELCRIAVRATNGIRSARAVSDPFRVAPKACRALIQLPLDGQRLDGQDVVLAGNGWWLEDARPELERLSWCSDRDGELGRGQTVRTTLSPGEHRLVLTAGDGERAGEEAVTVHVAAPASYDGALDL